MDNKKISIIVPVYNNEKYLSECIESLIRQTYKELEIILIDDGSSDNSGMICDEYGKRDSRIKVYHQKNQGVSVARNKGICESSGEYITFVDSDDYVAEDYCEALLNALDENTDMVIGRTIAFTNDFIDDGYRGGEEETFSSKQEKAELYQSIFIDNKKLVSYPHISTCSAKLIKKAVLTENGIVYNTGLKLYEDALLNMMIINVAKKVKVIDKKLYFYRYDNISATKSFRSDSIEQYRYVYECMDSFSKENGLALDEYYDYFKIKNLNTILNNYVGDKLGRKGFYKLLRDTCINGEYKSAVQNIKLSSLPKRRKVLVLCLRLRLLLLIYVLYCYF